MVNGTDMISVSILGLGIVGSRIARHLISEGVDVTVWNRTPKDDFPKTAPSPTSAAAASNIVCLYLKDKKACEEVFESMKPALTREHIIINHSTIDRATVMDLARQCAELGCVYLDCPFTGSKLAAEAGQLAYYVSGNHAAIESVRPLLEKSSKAILNMGELGNATVMKLVTNLLSATMVQGLSEAFAISRAYGIDADQLLEAISANVVSSPLASFKLPYMARRDFEAHFSLDNMRKDSTYAIQLANDKGISPPSILLVSEMMAKLCQEGDANLDFCSLVKQFDGKE